MDILLLDDESYWIGMLTNTLDRCGVNESEGFTIRSFTTGESLYTAIEQATEAPTLIFSDYRLGNEDTSSSYLAQIKKIFPFVTIVLCTREEEENLNNEEGWYSIYLHKSLIEETDIISKIVLESL